MPRASCNEDTYEYHIKRIFRELRKEHSDFVSSESFENWVYSKYGLIAAGRLFLEDVEQWDGFPEPDDDD